MTSLMRSKAIKTGSSAVHPLLSRTLVSAIEQILLYLFANHNYINTCEFFLFMLTQVF